MAFLLAKTARSVIFCAALLLCVAYFGSVAQVSAAQSAEEVCGSQDGSDFDSCVDEVNEKLAECDASGAGSSTWASCRSAVFEEYQAGANQVNVRNDCTEDEINESNCGIVRYIVMFINLLSALVGVVVVISIIVGGIQYSSAGSDPQKVSAAKNRIRNALIALTFFIFTYAFLNYLVPGGVL